MKIAADARQTLGRNDSDITKSDYIVSLQETTEAGSMGPPEMALSTELVFITHELDERPPRKADYLAEKLALQDLAARMADEPEKVLPRFVDLAMEMTGGVSAGLSLYEENPAPGVFRWQYLRGLLSPFNGATTPRNFSPCGITLDRNAPVLSRHPERAYDWIADANITVPEVLLVPLRIGGADPLGTLWIVSGEVGHFDSGDARAMTELASFVGIALRMVRTEQRLQRALDEQETLTREMGHRINNLFAMTDGLIRLSARCAANKDELAQGLSGRMYALSQADALVQRRAAGPREPTAGVELAELIRTVVRPHEGGGVRPAVRFSLDGPSVRCGDRAAHGTALIFHELATNAAKYGALLSEQGRVAIDWRLEKDTLTVCWTERGGPLVNAVPALGGFGSTLIRSTVTKQFGGSLDYNWGRGSLD